MEKQPIGVFDSGVGGLTVLRALLAANPQESYIYFGDEMHLPYGKRSLAEVDSFVEPIVDFLCQKHNVKALVVACNTASVASISNLQARLPIPVFGMIEAGTRAALRASQTKKVGLFATEATVNSEAYQRELYKVGMKEVATVACPSLVGYAERLDRPKLLVKTAVERYWQKLAVTDIDTLILGCTHFPLLENEIHEVLPEVTLVDPAQEVAKQVLTCLGKKVSGDASFHFYTTGETKPFQKKVQEILGLTQATVEHIAWEEINARN